ncbi:hypothetical protein EYF80_061868 [Liparis tanakae]|uniref:Uncharacterized protein n=1 Tax=Liparis tanakae TaxID=230148 RepID=A0A4Z2EGY2_9TELE|nr:hypothetical protein EYF80_061868 [Liparis tanakae]
MAPLPELRGLRGLIDLRCERPLYALTGVGSGRALVGVHVGLEGVGLEGVGLEGVGLEGVGPAAACEAAPCSSVMPHVMLTDGFPGAAVRSVAAVCFGCSLFIRLCVS